jgi:putative flippase GtrA
MIDKIKSHINTPMFRYLVMAVIIVLIELFTFFIINTPLGFSYLVATPASMAIGIVLNWYFSKKYVFKSSRFKSHVELSLVIASSLVGMGIQLAVTSITIEKFGLIPIIGKFFAIVVTFFWNFYIRKYYIFKGTD